METVDPYSLRPSREARRESAANNGTLLKLSEQYVALQQEALLANPLLDFEKLLIVRRRGHLGMPQNGQGNCALPQGSLGLREPK